MNVYVLQKVTKIQIVFSFLPFDHKDRTLVSGELEGFSNPGMGNRESQKRTKREIDNLLVIPLESNSIVHSTVPTPTIYVFFFEKFAKMKLNFEFQ